MIHQIQYKEIISAKCVNSEFCLQMQSDGFESHPNFHQVTQDRCFVSVTIARVDNFNLSNVLFLNDVVSVHMFQDK